MQKRTWKDYFVITLKGMAMGAADVVPGVSGGTIAFISNIYDELLDSINAINFSLIPILKKEGLKKAWQTVNGNFLSALFAGIFISILSLAKVLSWLLINKPILVWAFFFGLVLASILFVLKQVKIWNYKSLLGLILGIVGAFYITQISPAVVSNPSLFYLLLSGAIAICAMILPGISGSFILVLLGVYSLVLDAVHQMKLEIIATIAIGALIGLTSFSRILKYFLNQFRNITLAVLAGFIIGSLNKIWPWKEVLDSQIINEKMIVLKDKSIFPNQFQGDPQILVALVLALIGFLLIVILEKWANKNT